MNVHSRKIAVLQIHPDAPDRRTRILDAAERRFVRQGFHLTTMQDIAAEAGMSAGNLYRYFASKEALVEGLCERDRGDVARDLEAFEGAEDILGVFEELGRRHLADEPRDKAILCLQIWTEATRSPAVAGFVSALNSDIVTRLTDLIDAAREAGRVTPAMPSRNIAMLIATLADGLFVRRAVVPGFDAEAELPPVLALIAAMVEGRVVPRVDAPAEESVR